jgi:hypothetical protein
MGNMKAAIAFSTAIDEDNLNGELYFYRAVAYSKLREKSKALNDLEKSGFKTASVQLNKIRQKNNTLR